MSEIPTEENDGIPACTETPLPIIGTTSDTTRVALESICSNNFPVASMINSLPVISNENDLKHQKILQAEEKALRDKALVTHYTEHVGLSADMIQTGMDALKAKLPDVVNAANIAVTLDELFDTNTKLTPIKQMYLDAMLMKLSEHIRHFTNRSDVPREQEVDLESLLHAIKQQTTFSTPHECMQTFTTFAQIETAFEPLHAIVQKNKFYYTTPSGNVDCPPTIRSFHRQMYDLKPGKITADR